MNHWSSRQLDEFDNQAPLSQRSLIGMACNMENRPLSSETCVFSQGNLDASFEAGVSMPDLKPAHQLSPSALQQYGSVAERWLTSESPVARLNSFCSAQAPRDPHRLPSLPGYVPISTAEHVSNPTTYQGDILADLSASEVSVLQDPFHLRLSDVSNGQSEAPPAMAWQQTAVPMGDVYYRSPYSLSDEQLNFSPYSTPGYYDDECDSPMNSPTLSSPELDGHAPEMSRHRDHRWMPRSAPKDEDYLEDVLSSGAKPYAQLIQECLLQAPGHRMMLRDIYDWFERNTTKPRESGGNGWQNSIRHNLSMNKVYSCLSSCQTILTSRQAFENDKTTATNAKGEPKKATSVWYLTERALRNGVESTTRYRKKDPHNPPYRRSAYNRDMDWKRQSSGRKGGKATRKATQLRRMEAAAWASSLSQDHLDPFDSLIHAANAVNDYPGTRASTPSSPLEHYPRTPRAPTTDHEYGAAPIQIAPYHANAAEYNDILLQDALCQAGYSASAADLTWT
jgi:hypothetical protein